MNTKNETNLFCSRLRLGKNRKPRAFVIGWALSLAVLGVSNTHAQPKLGLAALVQETLDQHPAIRAQQSQAASAVADVEAAKWSYWPTPSLSLESASAQDTDTSYAGDAVVGVFRLQQPLWTGGRLGANLDKSEARVLMADAGLVESKHVFAARVIQAWGDLVVAQRKLQAYTNSRDTHVRLLAMVQRRQTEGVSAASDVLLANSRIGVLNAEIDLLQAQQKTALDRLSSLSGRRLSLSSLDMGVNLPLFQGQDLLSLVAEAQLLSPSVQAATHAADAAMADIRLARSSLLPEMYLRYEHQQGNHATADAPNTNRVFVGFNTVLGAGLSSFSGVSRAVAQHEAAKQDIDVKKQSVQEQVESDWALWQAAQQRLRNLQLANQASIDIVESYERQFLAGRKQWLDLMNAAREQAQSASQLADAVGALQVSGLRLLMVTRGVEALVSSLATPEPANARP